MSSFKTDFFNVRADRADWKVCRNPPTPSLNSLLEDTLTSSQCLDVGKGLPRCPPVLADLEGRDGFLACGAQAAQAGRLA